MSWAQAGLALIWLVFTLAFCVAGVHPVLAAIAAFGVMFILGIAAGWAMFR